MRTAWLIGALFFSVALVILVFLAQHYRAERYQIIHTAFVSGTNQDALVEVAAICYSNEQLRKAVKDTNILDQAGMSAFNLDKPDLVACVISNYTVKEVVGRDELGFIVVRKSLTNGISFVVFKGKKRMLQFNYLDAARP